MAERHPGISSTTRISLRACGFLAQATFPPMWKGIMGQILE
jgi:hypothetical protein